MSNKTKLEPTRVGKLCVGISYIALLYFIYLMLSITVQYIPLKTNSAFLAIKTEEVKLSYYLVAFYLHVFSSFCILILGCLQFIAAIQQAYPKFHRAAGKIYLLLILAIAAPSGFIMGLHGNGGIYSQIAFCLQAVLWFYFTWMGLLEIRKHNVQKHKNYMLLSFALTLSAISLRLFKWIIVHTLALPPMDTYKIVVWLGWLFNLSIALGIILYKNRKINQIQ